MPGMTGTPQKRRTRDGPDDSVSSARQRQTGHTPTRAVTVAQPQMWIPPTQQGLIETRNLLRVKALVAMTREPVSRRARCSKRSF
jgi:hypothetical protein